jgi:predicted dehydrogenase
LVRAGDVTIPKLEFVEPLAAECEHFVECVRNGQKPLTDGYHGLDIVQTLEAAQLSLGQNGTSVPVARG